MFHTLLLIGAALAWLAVAYPSDHPLHGRHHAKRDETVVITDVIYVTVTGYPPWTEDRGSYSRSETTVGEISTVTPSESIDSSSTTPPETSSSLVTSTPSTGAEATTSLTSYSSSSSATTISSSSSSASTSGITASNLTPNGNKAGLSGYVGIQDVDAFADLAPYISWYSDYTPNTPSTQAVLGVGMLWGATGSPCGTDMSERLATFESMVQNDTLPEIMFGFYEPDCSCPSSSEMNISSAAADWDSLIVPLGERGSVLGSPSMCTQYNEDFLTPFNASISRTWDVTSIHINKPNLTEAQKDVEYYVAKYGKPVWVSEFACVYDQPSWSPCTNQTTIDTFINHLVEYFEGNSDVVAYGPSNGDGLGDVWPLITSDGQLSATGQTYLNAIKALGDS